MLKSLYPAIDWESVRLVGFDLDGALYDEADFISQVYRPIAAQIAAAVGGNEDDVYHQILQRWFEKGSSYDRIFTEVLSGQQLDTKTIDSMVGKCLDIFRSFEPDLRISPRVVEILSFLAKKYELFLLSDGTSALQRAKICSLQLERWFVEKNIAISGECGSTFAKPSTGMLKFIDAMEPNLQPGSVVYFGDRDIDRQFAKAAGFDFVQVFCMVPVSNQTCANE